MAAVQQTHGLDGAGDSKMEANPEHDGDGT